MRVGISLRSALDPPDPRTGARWMVEAATASWEAGLDSLFVGDHHATGGTYYQNVLLGRLLAVWGDRPAGALFLLPLWPSVLVAELVGTLAAAAAGPFVLQCAVGAGEAQFGALGADLRRRGPEFERRLAVVTALLAGRDVDGVRIGPRPPEPVEVWIGATARTAVDRAARLGDAWLAGPQLLPAEARELLAYYRGRCAAHGRVPRAVAIRRDVHVGTDDGDAWEVARPVLDAGYRGFDPGATVVGGPESVTLQLRRLADDGFTDVIVRPLAPGHDDALATIRRLEGVRTAVSDA